MRSILIVGTQREHHDLADVVENALAAQPELDILVVAPHSQPPITIASGNRARRRVRQIVCGGDRHADLAIAVGFLYALAADYGLILHLRADEWDHQPQTHELGRAARQPSAALYARSMAGGHTIHWRRYRQILSEDQTTCERSVIRIPAQDLRGAWSWIGQPLRSALRLDPQLSERGLEIDLTCCSLGSARTGRDVPIVWTQRTLDRAVVSGRLIADDLSAVWRLRPLHAMAPIVRGVIA
jgi:hypothetical protein